MIVDSHCHIGALGAALDGPIAVGRFLHRARACGIGHVVVMSAIMEDSRACNRRVAGWVRRLRPNATGLVYVHARRDRGRVLDLVREGVGRFGFRGVKVHRRDSPLSEEICEAAQSFSVPILYDPVGVIEPLEDLARTFISVRFIVPHLGSFDDDVRAQTKVALLLRELPNLWTDTAGIRCFDLLREAVQHAGTEKFLFGSDGPYLHPGIELAKVRALGLSQAGFCQVVSRNARGLFGIPSTATTPGDHVSATPRAASTSRTP